MTERLLDRLGPAYARFSPEQRAEHLRLLASISGEGDVALSVRPAGAGRSEVTVCAADRVGMLALLAGLFAAHRIDIADAYVFTVAGDDARWILDVFTVDTRQDDPRWEAVTDELVALVALLAERGRQAAWEAAVDRVSQAARDRGLPDEQLLPVEVEVDNESSADHTVLRLQAADTPGFLFGFSAALSLLDVNIEHVEVRTVGDQVRDTFAVTDRRHRKITRPGGEDELRYAAALIKQFTHLLPKAPNPVLALRQFGKLTRRLLSRPDWVTELAGLESGPVLEATAALLGASRYLWEDFLRMQHESLFPVLLDVPGLDEQRPMARLEAELAARLGETDEERAEALNRFKDREMFRIDLRHITGRVDFAGFSAELSDLADVVVAQACALLVRSLEARHGLPRRPDGTPCPWAALALGKHGGRELGFASDIEMIVAYGGDGRTDGEASVSNTRFFGELVQGLLRTLRARRQGTFRIDLRLRPHGSAGPLATSEEAFTRYFSPTGGARQYERLALVRLRPVAGDEALAARLLEARDGFVFGRQPVDPDDIAGLRRRQVEELVPAGRVDVKYSPGGLVDVEYFVQARQIAAGAADSGVRVPGVLQALDRLEAGGHLEPSEARRVREAYCLLRRLVDALRVVRGHAKDLTLPAQDSRAFSYLARRLGGESPEALADDVERTMAFTRALEPVPDRPRPVPASAPPAPRPHQARKPMSSEQEAPVVFLEGERLYLRPLEEEDLPRCQRWINEPEVRSFLLTPFPMDVRAERTFFEGLDRSTPRKEMIFAIVLKDGDRHIGNTGLHAIDWVARFGTTGTFIGEPSDRGQGYGPEAKALVLAYCFNTLGLRRLESSVLSHNTRSQRYLEKTGHREVGRWHAKFLRGGRWVDEILLEITAEEWRAGQEGGE